MLIQLVEIVVDVGLESKVRNVISCMNHVHLEQ